MPRPKKTETETEAPVLDPLKEQLLDTIISLEERLAKVEGGTAVVAAKQQTEQDKAQAEIDAEWAKLREEFADYQGLEGFQRRIEQGVDASNEIRFKGEPTAHDDPTGKDRYWHARWFNFSKDGRSIEAKNKNYTKVRMSDLQDAEAVAGSVEVDGDVRRGDRGQEVLMRIPKKLYLFAKKLEQLQREGKLSSESWTQNHLANQVAATVGATGGNADQAGSFVASKGFTVEISEGQTERDQVPV